QADQRVAEPAHELACAAAPTCGDRVGWMAVRGAASAGERPGPPVLARPAFDAAAPLAAGLRRIEEPVPGPAVPRRATDERPGGAAVGTTCGRPERQFRLAAVVQRPVDGA